MANTNCPFETKEGHCLFRLIFTQTDFADDLALIANSINNAQTLLNSLESAANCVGLYLNDTKTEYMSYTKTQSSIDNLVIKL